LETRNNVNSIKQKIVSGVFLTIFVLAFICAVRNSMIRSDRKNVKSCQSDVAGNTDEKCMGNCMVCPGNCRESNR